jgi:hypothetical protein
MQLGQIQRFQSEVDRLSAQFMSWQQARVSVLLKGRCAAPSGSGL